MGAKGCAILFRRVKELAFFQPSSPERSAATRLTPVVLSRKKNNAKFRSIFSSMVSTLPPLFFLRSSALALCASYSNCNFPINPYARLLVSRWVGWSIGLSVIISPKLDSHAPFWSTVYFRSED